MERLAILHCKNHRIFNKLSSKLSEFDSHENSSDHLVNLVGLVDDPDAVVAPMADTDKVGVSEQGEVTRVFVQLPLSGFSGLYKPI